METLFNDRFRVCEGKLYFDDKLVGYSAKEYALEKFVIDEVPLGAGANGITFRVFHKRLKVFQVLKLYFPKAAEETALNKAEQEAIKNANTDLNGVIAVVFDAGVFEYPIRLGYSLMESIDHFCTFKDFRKKYKEIFGLNGNTFDFENKQHKNYLSTALNLAAGFLKAVLTLYEKKVIDGDLNPGNILWIMNKDNLGDYANAYDLNLGELAAAHVKLIDMGSSAMSDDDLEGKARDSFSVFDTIRSLLAPAFSKSFKSWFDFSVKPNAGITDRFGLEYCPHYEENGQIYIIPPELVASMMLRLLVVINYMLGLADNGVNSYSNPDGKPDIIKEDVGYLNDVMHGEIHDDISVHSGELNDLLKTACNHFYNDKFIKWDQFFNTFPMNLIDNSKLVLAHQADLENEPEE